MSLLAIALIITSAFMHAGWNLISKRRSPTIAFFFITAVSGTIAVSPIFFLYREALAYIPPAVWGLITVTGIAQAVYFSGLAGAYQRGDISLAYPLARALPVLAVALVSILLGRGAEIGLLGLVGMLLITVGCVVLPLPDFKALRLSYYTDTVYLFAGMAAIGTTAYTVIDDSALRQLRAVAAMPLTSTEITLLFIAFQMLSTAVMIGLTTAISARKRGEFAMIIANRTLFISALLTGVVITATYGLVLASMAYVRDVSFVAAFRQLSIPIGAVLGLTLQNEARYRPKLIGIIVITIGLILVGIG